MDYFRQRSTLIKELDESGSGAWAYRMRVFSKVQVQIDITASHPPPRA